MSNYKKIAEFCNEDPILFRLAFVVFAGFGALKVETITANDIVGGLTKIARELVEDNNKNDLSDEDARKVVEMAKLMAELSSSSLFAIIQRELPAVEGNGREIPFLHEYGDKDDICPRCGAELEYDGEHEVDDSGYTIDWECPRCGATGKAGYTAVFDRHYKVRAADGDEIPGRDH